MVFISIDWWESFFPLPHLLRTVVSQRYIKTLRTQLKQWERDLALPVCWEPKYFQVDKWHFSSKWSWVLEVHWKECGSKTSRSLGCLQRPDEQHWTSWSWPEGKAAANMSSALEQVWRENGPRAMSARADAAIGLTCLCPHQSLCWGLGAALSSRFFYEITYSVELPCAESVDSHHWCEYLISPFS